MHSSLHGMIEKSHRYAEEPERLKINGLNATVHGSNGDHEVTLTDGLLRCDCDHHRFEGLCAHVLTVERVLKQHLPANAAPYPGAAEAAGARATSD